MNKYITVGIFYWMICVFTYGHAYKQFSTEAATCEARKLKTGNYEYCGSGMVRGDAFLASLFWPQHWSEALWK